MVQICGAYQPFLTNKIKHIFKDLFLEIGRGIPAEAVRVEIGTHSILSLIIINIFNYWWKIFPMENQTVYQKCAFKNGWT